MKCDSCDEKAVFQRPTLCKDHFLEYVEQAVQKTIDDHDLCSREQKICVAASGGKDSAALLAILKKLGYWVEALAVDEGIKGYRDASLEDLRGLCSQLDVPLKVVSFERGVGKPLDAMVEDQHPCSVCGVFRRYLLNKHAKGFDVVATGHNLDDEAQAVLMNLMKANHDLLVRSHIKTPLVEGFVPRIKPLMFLSEKELRAYTVLREFALGYDECPYVPQSMRGGVRDVLNRYERDHHGMKRSLVEAGLRIARQGVASLPACSVCGEPSAGDVCRACSLREQLVGDAS